VSTLKTQLVGRQTLLVVATGAGGIVTLVTSPLDPVSVGDRPGSVSAAFERFRIAKIVAHYKSFLSSTANGSLTMGIHDDAVASTAPSTSDHVLNFRTSVEFDVWKDSSMTYVPVDTSKWYYVNADSVNDPRFTQPAVLYLIGTNTLPITLPVSTTGTTVTFPVFASANIGQVVIEYHYVFDGASLVRD